MLLDPAVAQEHDAVGHRHRLDLVVRDVDHRLAQLLVQPFDLAAHLVAQLRIQVGQWFVEEVQARIAHHCAADCHALQLAARELARVAVEQVVDREHARGLAHLAIDLVGGRLARAQPEGDVVVHRHVRIERVILKHHRDVAPARRLVVDDLAADLDRSLVSVLEAGDRAQQRAFAAARLADKHRELAGRNLEIDTLHRMHVAVILVQPLDSEICHFSLSPRPSTDHERDTSA